MNKVILIGRLGQEPELRVTPTGQNVINISMATNEVFKDGQGQRKEKTEWHRLDFWGVKAELLKKFFHKGDQIGIVGSLQTREGNSKDGRSKQYYTNVHVVEIVVWPDRRNDQQAPANNGYQGQTNYPEYSEPWER